MPEDNKPIIFLTFANDRKNPAQFLKKLEPEREQLQSILYDYTEKGWGHYRTSSADPQVLIENLIRSQQQMVVFHYSGHADGQELFLEGMEGENIAFRGSNLMGILKGSGKTLKLVFLNACATQDHVDRLKSLGIPAIIATSQVINDQLALAFSKTFYQAMVAGDSLDAAFHKAKALVAPKEDFTFSGGGSLNFAGIGQGNLADTPWNLFYDDPRILNWTLVPRDFIDQRLRYGAREYYQLTHPEDVQESIEFSPNLLTRMSPGNVKLGDRKAIQQLWQENTAFGIVLGEGGMGKSVALMQLWGQYLDALETSEVDPLNPELASPVPVYVALHEFNHIPEGKRDSFLTRYIARHYLGEKSLSQDTEKQLWEWLREPWNKSYPRLILLLDGFNEIAVDKTPLLAAIKKYWTHSEEGSNSAQGIQVLITSQPGPDFSWARLFQTFRLEPLNRQQIEGFLRERKRLLPGTGRLVNLLSNPMMLSLYANTRQAEQQKDASTPGELLDSYIHSIIAGAKPENEAFREWLLLHLLAAICFEMEEERLFEFRRSQVKKATDRYLEQLRSRLYLYFEAFPECEVVWRALEDPEMATASLSLGFSKLITSLCEDVGIFRREGQRFTFPHQNFRNYFAARHIINELVLSQEQETPPYILRARPLRSYMRQILGEILGEHRHVAHYMPAEKKWSLDHLRPTLLRQVLENCRAKYDGEKMGFILWNLVSIWRQVRGDLGGMNLSQLYLSRYSISLNEIRQSYLSPQSPAGYLNTRYGESRLLAESFFPEGHTDIVTAIAYRADGKHFISSSRDGTLKVWSSEWGICLHTLELGNASITSLAYHPSKDLFLSGTENGTVTVWARQEVWASIAWVQLHSFAAHTDAVLALSYCDGGERFVSVSSKGEIKSWSTHWGNQRRISCPEKYNITKPIVCHPDSHALLATSTNKTVYEFDYSSGEVKRLRTTRPNLRNVKFLAFRYDGRGFLVATQEGHIMEYHRSVTSSRYEKGDLDIQVPEITALACHTDGMRFITAGKHGTITEWSTESGEILNDFPGMNLEIKGLALHADLKRFVSISDDDPSRFVLKEWDLETKVCRHTYLLEGKTTKVAAYDVEKPILFAATLQGTIESWSTETGEQLPPYLLPESASTATEWLHLLCDEKMIIAGSREGTVAIWEKQSRECKNLFQSGGGGILDFYREPKSDLLAAISEGYSYEEWDLASGKSIRFLQIEGNEKDGVAVFHPKERQLAFGQSGSLVEVPLDRLEEFVAPAPTISSAKKVSAVAYSLCGKSLLVAGKKGRVRTYLRKEESNDWENAHTLDLDRPLLDVVYINSEPLLFLGIDDQGSIQIYEYQAEAPENENEPELKYYTFDTKGGRANKVILSPCNGRFLTVLESPGDENGNLIQEFDIESGICIQAFSTTYGGCVRTVAYHPKDPKVFVGTEEGIIVEWSTSGGYESSSRKHSLEVPSAVTALAFADFGEVLISGAEDGSLCSWHLRKGKRTTLAGNNEKPVLNIFSQKDSLHFFVRYASAALTRWDVGSGRRLAANRWDKVEGLDIQAYCESRKSMIIRSESRLHEIQWDYPAFVLEATRPHSETDPGPEARETVMAYNTDGNKIACAFDSGHIIEWVRVHEPDRWQHIKTIDSTRLSPVSLRREGKTAITGIRYIRHPDGEECILASSLDGMIREWGSVEGELRHTWYNISGMWIQGCDLSEVQWAKPLTKRERDMLEMYGAILG